MKTFIEQAEEWARNQYPGHAFSLMSPGDWIQCVELSYRGGWRQFVSERYQ